MTSRTSRAIQPLFLTLILLTTSGCVGPMSPFGSISLFANKDGQKSIKRTVAAYSDRHIRVRFSPHRQVLHKPSRFHLIVEDPMGVPDDANIVLTYNGLDVTASFLSQAYEISSDPFRREVKWTTKDMRLPASRDHLIKASYKRDSEAPSVAAQYHPPLCSAFYTRGLISRVPDFRPAFEVIQQINQSSMEQNLNPFFIAAIVAQESGFNSLAVSSSRALGLTQVTPLGDQEISKQYSDWPRYPGASTLPFPILKMAVLGGQIHSGNEWRLDPTLSIQGGVAYIQYLNQYWRRPDKQSLIESRLGPSEASFSEVILASYNSGAARVAEALERRGADYLKDNVLTQASKYVHQVISYCDHFEGEAE